MAAEDIPEISPDRAAAQYLARQEVALQSRSPSSDNTPASPGNDATQGDATATAR